jgi:hypothetical protein
MTSVATSIPVLRVFFNQAVNSAIETYHNSSTRSRTKTMPPSPGDTLAQMSVLRRGSQNYVKLGDLMVDEKTGRVTTANPDLKADAAKRNDFMV